MRARLQSTPLAEILAEKIRTSGPIPFAEYMEACLYHPEFGYYAKTDQAPRRDYYTSVDVSPIFGRLLAIQFHQMWELLDRPDRFLLVEAGAGTGALAKQILDFAAVSLGDFYAAMKYVAVERSPARRAKQEIVLAPHVERARFTSASELPASMSCGVIFSNELLDALPVHRVVEEKGSLKEIYVALGDAGLCEETGPLSTPAIAEYFREQRVELREGQQAEAGLAARDWVVEAGRRLERGYVMTIDYGHEARELYDERHMRGTLLAYDRHRASEEFYRAAGEQDLTAHVNFTALDLRGRRAGLERTGLVSQTNFLLSLARQDQMSAFEAAGETEEAKLRARLQFKTLIHPEGMGETFQVFIQHKGIETPKLAGLAPL
jgi:SAM-dependent MidA family methyltransferase